MSTIGHNSGLAVDPGHLKSYIDRVENLEDDRKAVIDDIKVVYSEAKSSGYNPKIIRKIVAMRRQDQEKLEQEQEELDLYLAQLEKAG